MASAGFGARLLDFRARRFFTVDAFTGNLTPVVHFPPVDGAPSAGNGVEPAAGLVEDENGNLWGTTSGGGSRNLGTIFKIDPKSNVLKTGARVHRIGATRGRLSGEPHGTRQSRQPVGDTPYVDGGTVYRIRPASGEFTTMARFTTVESGYFSNALLSDGIGNYGVPQGVGAVEMAALCSSSMQTVVLRRRLPVSPTRFRPISARTPLQGSLPTAAEIFGEPPFVGMRRTKGQSFGLREAPVSLRRCWNLPGRICRTKGHDQAASSSPMQWVTCGGRPAKAAR